MEPLRPEVGDPAADADTLRWFEEGEAIAGQIAEVVHGDRDAQGVDERAVREWQAIGRDAELRFIGRMAELGREARTGNA